MDTFPCRQREEKKEAGGREGAGISEGPTYAPRSRFHTPETQVPTERLLPTP